MRQLTKADLEDIESRCLIAKKSRHLIWRDRGGSENTGHYVDITDPDSSAIGYHDDGCRSASIALAEIADMIPLLLDAVKGKQPVAFTAQADQAAAQIIDHTPPLMAAFYKRLIKEGFSEEQAMQLTAGYFINVLSASMGNKNAPK